MEAVLFLKKKHVKVKEALKFVTSVTLNMSKIVNKRKKICQIGIFNTVSVHP